MVIGGFLLKYYVLSLLSLLLLLLLLKFIELCMESPRLCPSEGHKHGGRNVTETSVIEFCH